VIPQTILPLLLSRSIIFPGTMLGGYAAIGSMLAMWILFSLTLGRGWCGWGCFFGGLDDLFSRLRKAPVLSLVSDNWSNVSVAVLIVTVLFSAASLAPFYCSWLCPYKAVTEFREVHGLTIFLQTVVFMTLFIGLVVVLPILTKKRTQCGILCPFGAFQSAANCINPFELRVDAAKCVDCGACVRGCPVFAMTGESKALGRARLNCIKCGKCADICPTGAVYHHVKLTKNAPSRAQRLMFLYPAFIFISTIGGGMMQHAVGRIFRLFTTGSIF
jgi:polyferredoxin